eukprot:2480442-Prymnesium_polylepis.2
MEFGAMNGWCSVAIWYATTPAKAQPHVRQLSWRALSWIPRQYGTERPDVRGGIVGSTVAQLGREVVGCSNSGVGKVAGGAEQLRDAEVADSNGAVRAKQKVGRLEVAVKDLEPVDVLQPLGHLEKVLPDAVLSKW